MDQNSNNTHPSVAVVILNWNGKHWLEKFLPSVVNTAYEPLSIYVGDNASTDNSLQFIRETFPLVQIIENDQNYGFAEGYNRVLAQIEADYFVLLNSDVEVSENWILPVVRLMEQNERIAAAQPKIKSFHQPRLFEYAGAAGGYIDAFGYPFCKGRIFDTIEMDRGQYNQSEEIFWASGAAFFIKKKYWQLAGGFDSDLFAHMEEIDLCWRIQNMGYKILYCPDSEIFHVGGGTLNSASPHKTYLNFRNNLIIMQKNMPTGMFYRVLVLRLFLDFFALLKFAAGGEFKLTAAVSRAHRHFFSQFRTTSKKRKQSVIPVGQLSGWYNKSIVVSYFIRRVRTFSRLRF